MTSIDAAVLHGPRDLTVERVDLAPPEADEVRVKICAAGVCHTDYARYAGESNVRYPVILGHEGAGIVEAVGERVTTVEPGDRVVLTVTTHCGSCAACDRGKPFLCENDGPVHDGRLIDGTRRLSIDGEPIDHFFAQSSFATRAVVPATTAISIQSEIPFERMALLGCCASTGVGSVLSTATVEPASSVAVFGCGGVGMSAVLGGVTVGASPLVAVDVATNRLEMAAELGATHTVDPRSADVVEHVVDLTHGGADYTFECSGNQQAGEQALAATRKGGTVVMVGGGDPENALSVHPSRDLVPGGKTIVGSVAGSLRPHEDIPRYARLCADGHLNLDALITHRYDLSKLPSAFETMAAGAGVRGVVTFD